MLSRSIKFTTLFFLGETRAEPVVISHDLNKTLFDLFPTDSVTTARNIWHSCRDLTFLENTLAYLHRIFGDPPGSVDSTLNLVGNPTWYIARQLQRSYKFKATKPWYILLNLLIKDRISLPWNAHNMNATSAIANLECFNGNQPARQWIRRFEALAAANGWSSDSILSFSFLGQR